MALVAQRTGSRRRPSAKTAASEAATEAERIDAALSWPSFPEPSPLGEEAITASLASLRGGRTSVVRAWSYNESAQTVVLGCYNKSGHSKRTATAITTQGQGGPWFATATQAAQALHWAIARSCAKTLEGLSAVHADAQRSDAMHEAESADSRLQFTTEQEE